MWKINKIVNGIGFWLFRKIIGYENFRREEMTRCRNCYSGIVGTIPEEEHQKYYLINARICPCCGGDCTDCKNCIREFPSSIEAVQMGND